MQFVIKESAPKAHGPTRANIQETFLEIDLFDDFKGSRDSFLDSRGRDETVSLPTGKCALGSIGDRRLLSVDSSKSGPGCDDGHRRPYLYERIHETRKLSYEGYPLPPDKRGLWTSRFSLWSWHLDPHLSYTPEELWSPFTDTECEGTNDVDPSRMPSPYAAFLEATAFFVEQVRAGAWPQ